MSTFAFRPLGTPGALVWLLLSLPAAASPAVPEIDLLSERALPEDLQRARDVRFVDGEAVALAVSGKGTIELPLDPERRDVKRLVVDGDESRGVWLSSRLGLSESYLTVASPVFSLSWMRRPSQELAGRAAFEDIEDIDVFSNRLAVLGFRRAENGDMAPDGAIAWVGSLDLELSDLRPVLFSTAGAGAAPMDACANFEIGAVRFLPDGTLLVVPGAEPGAFLYDQEGKLLHAWDTEGLGLLARCDFDDRKKYLLSGEPEARWNWINQFRVVEEILPLPQGPGLLIRESGAAGTSWRLVVLDRRGPAVSHELPVSSPSRRARLRADVRGNRVVFLVFDETLFIEAYRKVPAEDSVAVPPRLVVGRIAE